MVGNLIILNSRELTSALYVRALTLNPANNCKAGDILKVGELHKVIAAYDTTLEVVVKYKHDNFIRRVTCPDSKTFYTLANTMRDDVLNHGGVPGYKAIPDSYGTKGFSSDSLCAAHKAMGHTSGSYMPEIFIRFTLTILELSGAYAKVKLTEIYHD